MYYVNFHTGAGNFRADTLTEAMARADREAAYTQHPITISKDGEIVAMRRWYGYRYNAEYDLQADPILFGDFGFYGDWQ